MRVEVAALRVEANAGIAANAAVPPAGDTANVRGDGDAIIEQQHVQPVPSNVWFSLSQVADTHASVQDEGTRHIIFQLTGFLILHRSGRALQYRICRGEWTNGRHRIGLVACSQGYISNAFRSRKEVSLHSSHASLGRTPHFGGGAQLL